MEFLQTYKLSVVSLILILAALFETPKFFFMVAKNEDSPYTPMLAYSYRIMPQFGGSLILDSSVAWLFLHATSALSLLLSIAITVTGRELPFYILYFYHGIFWVLVTINANHLAGAPAGVAILINSLLFGVFTSLLFYEKYYAYLLLFSVPVWLFDTATFVMWIANGAYQDALLRVLLSRDYHTNLWIFAFVNVLTALIVWKLHQPVDSNEAKKEN